MDNIAHKYNRVLIAILVFSPFLAYFSLSMFGKDFKMFLQMLSYLGVFLMLVVRERNQPIKFPRYLVFYLLFIFYVFYSAFFKLDREFKLIYLFKNGLIGGFNLLFIIENIIITKKHYEFILRWSKLILPIAVVVIVLQNSIDKSIFVYEEAAYLFNSKVTITTEDRLHSIYSWIGPLENGFGFIPVFILLIEYLYRKKKKILILILVGLLYAILTKWRWIMLNSFLVFFILITNRKDKTKQFFKYLILVPTLMYGSYLALNIAGIDMEKIIVNRVLELNEKGNKRSAGTRIRAFKVFNKVYWKNPIFGAGNYKYGMGNDGRNNYELSKLLGGSSQIHVGYLALFYRYGLVGGIFFIGFLFLLLKKLYRSAKITTYWAPFLGVLGFAIFNLTNVNFSIFHTGLIIAITADRYYFLNTYKTKNSI